MHVITIVQTKGGSGKTTTAMLMASAALDAGRRVTLIDGDVNAQLGRWRDSFELAVWEAVKKPTWPEALSILSPPETVDGLLALLEEEEARGVDLVVIDTRQVNASRRCGFWSWMQGRRSLTPPRGRGA
jgi:chromosome partitioning protein